MGSDRPTLFVPLALGFWLAVMLALAASPAAAQTPQGATLTVVSGEVAVVRAAGGALQPSPSGLTLAVGDQVATVDRSSTALVTFFEGSELELGWNTTVILREIQSTGNEVHVTVEDVLGTTFGRVQTFVNPNSTFKLQSPGGRVVALVRGSFAQMTVYENSAVAASVRECSRICEIIVEGASVVGDRGGAVTVDQKGAIRDGNNPEVNSSVPGGGGDTTGNSTGSAPPGQEGGGSGGDSQGTDDGGGGGDDEGGGYGYRGTVTPMLARLGSYLFGQSLPWGLPGVPLALGVVGWGWRGRRSGQR